MTARPPDLPGVEHHYIDAGAVRLHVAEAGEGEPVVMLHGWPQNWYEWRHLIPPLAERYRVLCPDLRGFGWSEVAVGGYDKETLAQDVVGLLDALELERVNLVGHDWGGMIGFILCLRHPERIRRYLALNTGHLWAQLSLREARWVWRFWYQLVLASPWLSEALQRGDQKVLRRSLGVGHPRAPFSEADAEVFLGPLREPERARVTVAVYRTFLLREMPALARGRYAGQRLRVPILWLHGEKDPVLRPQHVLEVERHADDVTIELVPGVGHFIADEAPELVADRALAFFGKA